MLEDFLQIIYIVVLDEDYRGMTPFCGFNADYSDYLLVFWNIIEFPTNICEVGKNSANQLKTRIKLKRAHKIIPLYYDSYLRSEPEMPFYCVLYNSEKFQSLPKIKKNWKNEPFFIDFKEIKKITYKDFYKHYKKSIDNFFINYKSDYKIMLDPPSQFELKFFNTFIFTAVPCYSFNKLNNEIKEQIFQFNEGIQTILKLDGKKSNGIDFILTTAPLFSREELKNVLAKCPDKDRLIIKRLIYQKEFKYNLEDDNNDFLNTRINEFKLYQFCMGLVFEHYMCPIYQIEPGLQISTKNELLQAQKAALSKQTQIAKSFYYDVNLYYDSRIFKNMPYDRIARIKIYSDAPVEYFIDKRFKLPILVSSNITKIPMTPGTDFFNQISLLSDVYVPFHELTKILVIKSFEDSESNKKIKNVFTDKLTRILKSLTITVTIKNVRTSLDVVELLNSSEDYSIVIFDCHGSIDKGSHGTLVLEEENFDIWEKRNLIKNIPPIVLFSCCLANVYNSSAFSIANGFLVAGVRATLATTTEVTADITADFMTKIILKIDEYAKLINKKKTEGEIIIWSDLMCNIFRALFVSEVLEHFKIKGENKIKISKQIEDLIFNSDLYWYETLILELKRILKIGERDLQEEILDKTIFFESLKYINLGNADKIKIYTDENLL